MNRKQQLLRALWRLAKDDEQADLGIVAELIGVSCVETDELLQALDRDGLVDAERCRLTMSGLVCAVSAESRSARSQHDRDRPRSASRAA